MADENKIMLDVPFYKNSGDGKRCFQTAMNSAIKYFLDEDFPLKDLDIMTGRKTGKWTFTTQIIPALYELGLDIKYYSTTDPENYIRGEEYIKDTFGKDAKKMLENIDVDVMVDSAKNVTEYDVFEKKKITIEEIEEHIRQEHIVMVLIDANVFSGKDGFQGHFVVLTGYDEDHIYYHETGPKEPEPNRKIKKNLFILAMQSHGTDNDCVIVFGRR
jgi:hypothetical protein